jgi:deoxyxylulose-5-phosphate synthase
MTTFLTVIPAYGRDYKSAKAAKEDWHSGKDFIESTSNRYISRAELTNEHTNQFAKPIEVMVRYKKLTMIGKLETFK